MPRTTLDLDPTVLRELRRVGAEEGKSMGQVASELLAPALTRGPTGAGVEKLSWISGDLGAPRADLEDKEAVRALLERSS